MGPKRQMRSLSPGPRTLSPRTAASPTRSNRSRSPDLVTLTISLDEENGKSTKNVFTFKPTVLVMDVKVKAATLFSLPLSQQRWVGWPSHVKDYNPLSMLGTSNLRLNLTRKSPVADEMVSRDNLSALMPNESRSIGSSVSMLSADIDRDYSDTEDNQSAVRFLRGGKRLLDDESPNDVTSQEQFMRRFRERYGENHPSFFLGSLQDAVASGCHLPIDERRLLAIYAHHDRSEGANIFCQGILTSRPVIETLDEFFLTWAWDCTLESNRDTFYQLLRKEFGLKPKIISLGLESYHAYPFFIIVSYFNGVFDIMHVIRGCQPVDQVVATMKTCSFQFSERVNAEKERIRDMELKMQQNAAYLESLAADKAKDEMKRKEESRKRREAQKLKEKEAKMARKREESAKRVVPEPDSTYQGDVTKVRIRTPNGETVIRKFGADAQVGQLFVYLDSLGFMQESYRYVAAWDRKELAPEDKHATFRDKQLTPTASLVIETRIK